MRKFPQFGYFNENQPYLNLLLYPNEHSFGFLKTAYKPIKSVKVGCVFSMVIVSILSHAEFRPRDAATLK